MPVGLIVYDYDANGVQLITHDVTMGFSRIIGFISVGGTENFDGSFTVSAQQLTGSLFAYFERRETPSRQVGNRFNRGGLYINNGNQIQWYNVGVVLKIYYGVTT